MDTVIPPTIDVHLTPADLRAAMEADVRRGLTSSPKELPPVYFYDDRGSRLFDEITRLPEYYPTRAERSILEAHAKDMVAVAGADTLIELGAGTCDKSRVLLDAMRASGRLGTFVPLDVSDTTLWEAATAIATGVPGPGRAGRRRRLPPPPRAAGHVGSPPVRVPRGDDRQLHPRAAVDVPRRAWPR